MKDNKHIFSVFTIDKVLIHCIVISTKSNPFQPFSLRMRDVYIVLHHGTCQLSLKVLQFDEQNKVGCLICMDIVALFSPCFRFEKESMHFG